MIFFKPTWDHGWGIDFNREKIWNYINWISLHDIRAFTENKILGDNNKPWPLRNDIPFSSYLFLPIIFLFIFYSFIKETFQRIKNHNIDSNYYCKLFMILSIIYVTLVSNFIELAENDRYRVLIDTFVFVLLVNYLAEKIKILRFIKNESN